MTAEEQLRLQVRAALQQARISQAEAARRLGLTPKHVSCMLTGRATFYLAWAEQLLALCGMRLTIAIQLETQDSP